jgi:hypothetical protein
MQLVLVITIVALTGLLPVSSFAQESAPNRCISAEISGLQAIQYPQERQEAIRKYRNTLISGYNATEFNTAVTVYVYDKEPITELLQEFRASGSEVLAAHAGAESPMSGPAKLPVAGNSADGFLGVFLWTEGETDFGSFLWIGELSGKYVKIRTTYVRPEQDDQTAAAMSYAMTAMRSVASHVCDPSSPSNNSFRPKPLRGLA